MKQNKVNSINAMFQDLAFPLHRFVMNLVKNSHDAEDLVSDTFVRIIEYIDGNGRFPEKALCYAIARNLSIDFLRRKKKIVLPDTYEILGDIEEDWSLEKEVEDNMYLEYIETLIKQLPEAYANVFSLKFYDGMSFEEIGRVMNLSEGNARILYYRARLKMKDMLEKEKEVV